MNAASDSRHAGLLGRFQSLSRPTRWAIGGGLVIASYFLVVEPSVDATSRRLSASESTAAVIATHAETARAMPVASEVRAQGVRKFGLIELSRRSREAAPRVRPGRSTRSLKRHGVRRSADALAAPRRSAQDRWQPRWPVTYRVDRMMRDVKFAADPDAAAAVVADLERSPDGARRSRACRSFRQADGRDRNAKMVRVTMTVETWLQARKGRSDGRHLTGILPDQSVWAAAGRLLTPRSGPPRPSSAVSALVCGWFLVPLALDAVKPAPKPLKKIDDPAKNAKQQKVTFDGYLAQVKGRSLFSAPRAQASAAVEAVDADKPPPPPSSYGGPSIIAMLSDAVSTSLQRSQVEGGGEARRSRGGGLDAAVVEPPQGGKASRFDVGFFERSRPTKEPKDAAGRVGTAAAARSDAAASPASAGGRPLGALQGGGLHHPNRSREPRSDQARGGRDRRQRAIDAGRGTRGEPR
jgi:hypothetical protein